LFFNIIYRGDIVLKKYGDVLSVEELCEVLKLGKNTVYRLLKEKEIKSFVIAGKYRIPKKCVHEFIFNNTKD